MLPMIPIVAITALLTGSPWRIVNDDVMGGVSNSEIVAGDNGIRFQGVLSLENNGGFASVRRSLDSGLGQSRGIRLRVCGDGRSYQFGVRLNDNLNGVWWRAPFDTADQSCQTIDLLFDAFRPMYRGRVVNTGGPLDPARIRQLSFLLADKQAGPFQLDITSIETLALDTDN